MAEELAAVDRPRKSTARGSRQAGEDESLELASSITNFNGQRLKFLRAHGRAYFCGGGREQRRGGRYFHFFRLTAHLQRHVNRNHLRDRHENLVDYFCLETLLLCFQPVSARRHSHPVIAGAAGGGWPLHSGLDVRNREREIGNCGAARIRYCSCDGAKITLPVDRFGCRN